MAGQNKVPQASWNPKISSEEILIAKELVLAITKF